jgi:pectinesterase
MKTLFCLLFLASFSLQAQNLVVATDGSGDYTSLQDAVRAVRDHSPVRVEIFIKNGVYPEKLVVPSWKPNIHFVGESVQGVRIIGDDYAGKPLPHADGTGFRQVQTYTSYTVLIDAENIIMENLSIENIAGPISQAVALHVEGDRFQAINCRIFGNQDTLFCSREGSRQYYKNCLITGTTDFIFGKSIAVFQACTIVSKKNSYITAAATPAYQDYGFVFLDCELQAVGAERVYLGRPWRPFAKTVFIRTKYGQHIRAEGWDNWRDPANEHTAFYAEFPKQNNRVKWAKFLSEKELEQYSLMNIFKDWAL